MPRPEHAPTFTIARNPDPDTTLPYLLRLPMPDGPLVLKAAETWPRTAKVYCHRADGWPEDPEIVEEVPVRVCRRRGVAIDLVLDRARENRSQLIFTTHPGRPRSDLLAVAPHHRQGPPRRPGPDPASIRPGRTPDPD